jgi:mannose-1-phosphate guanylyltransferase/mannose-6-phosphate isomerase
MTKIIPAILCGGVGSRLWPMSRALYPKQLLPLLSEQTMLQETVARVSDTARFAAPMMLCNSDHRFLIAAQLQEAGAAHGGIILEPAGRNTAPAVALAALHADTPDALLLVLSADHLIAKPEAFLAAVDQAAVAAKDGHLVTFGIEPNHPSTGYGYIRVGASDVAPGVSVVEKFVEKPDLATAEGFVADGGYRWNAGMFLFRADRYLEELERHAPDILAACRASMDGAVTDLDFIRPAEDAFLACRADSIDYAVMEKSDRAAVAPCDLGWSDIGSWAQLWDVGDKDAAGNVSHGDTLLHDASGCYVRSEDKLIAAVGVEDLVIVSTPDAMLVTRKDRAQDVKHIVDRLKSEGREEHNTGQRCYRPWGFYEGIHIGERHQVKHICVNPGAALSLQMHHHRAEHWIVVKGTARVTRDDEVLLLTENEGTYIPLGATHRLENPGKVPLSMVEVQSGSYLGEDDIVRFEDVYNRVGEPVK